MWEHLSQKCMVQITDWVQPRQLSPFEPFK